MNVNTRLVIWRMQTTEKSRHDVDTVIFFTEVSEACQLPLFLVVSTNTSMVLGLGRCTCQDWPPRGSPRHHSQVRYLMTRSNRVALHNPREVSTNLSQITSPEHRTISLHASMEPLATKSSRRWQPPRVTSTPACNTII